MSWTVAGIVRRHAKERPDRPAISYDGKITTWAELDSRTNRVAKSSRPSPVKLTGGAMVGRANRG